MRKVILRLLVSFALLFSCIGDVIAADGILTQPPLAYLGVDSGAVVTITAHERLSDILNYNGSARNMHIAKWIVGDPAALEYSAYCVNPGIRGVASHPDDQYTIKPKAALTEAEKKVLGIMRSGYPYKTPAELSLDSIQDAFYATQAGIWAFIENGDNAAALSNWTTHSGDTDRNNRILNAMTNIYNTGRANPYSPPEIVLLLEPNDPFNDGTALEEGTWITNNY